MSNQTPHERYRNDATYSHLVDMLTALIMDCQYSPSEMREAVILASIKYEESRPYSRLVDPRLESALRTIHEFTDHTPSWKEPTL